METIRSNSEISDLFAKGKKISNKFATFIYTANGTESEHGRNGRVAFIAGKRIGNAVWRNAAKRRMREIYRACSKELIGLDILFVAKSQINDETYSKVLSECYKTLKKVHERTAKTD